MASINLTSSHRDLLQGENLPLLKHSKIIMKQLRDFSFLNSMNAKKGSKEP